MDAGQGSGALRFRGSPRPTIGVEIEVQLIHPETRDLVALSIPLLEKCREAGIDHVKAELTQAMIEIDTGINPDVKACREDLTRTFSRLRSVAEALQIRLAVSGTHPFQRWTDRKVFPLPRYEHIFEKFRWLARRVTVYGVHVHIGVESGDRAIAILNAATPYLPHLLALSASSPYWDGVDTGMVSCRAGLMESFPISGLPHYFESWREFEHYCSTLLGVGAIASPKDLYWFVRPNPGYGTIEFRICDGIPTLSETLSLVALIQALVVWLDGNIAAGLPPERSRQHRWIAPENQWIAARDGLDGTIILAADGEHRKLSEDVLALLERLGRISEELGSSAELEGIKRILQHGSSARRQRRVYDELHSLVSVVDALCLELETDRVA